MLSYEIRRESEHKVANWAGGKTTELYVYPFHSSYADRNFDFRISSASVELEASEFTSLPGFKRHIMLLDGEMRLEHEGHHSLTLERYGQDFFDGAWKTFSFGKCVDFNLMLKDGIIGGLRYAKDGELIVRTDSFTAFYSLAERVRVCVTASGGDAYECVLGRHDFLLIHCTEPPGEYHVVTEYAQGLSHGESPGIFAFVS